jgi:hypothetical protein
MARALLVNVRISGSAAAVLFIACCCFPRASAASPPPATLDAGFAQLYELNFSDARAAFDSYIHDHPDDPMGPAALAASYLFEEFNKQGILTSSFFLNDRRLLGGVPDVQRDSDQDAFLQAAEQARQMAQKRLDAKPRDPDGLLALTLANGMQADFEALIARQDMASLWLLRQTKQSARLLLSINPHADDAYLALGAANYIIGCLPGYKRFFLSLGGIRGDRALGMRQLKLASDHGHYLKPFAKVMLALAALREKQPGLARSLLTELHRQFPRNPDFASELAKLN